MQFRLRLAYPEGICILLDKSRHEIIINFNDVEWFGVRHLNRLQSNESGNDGIVLELGMKFTSQIQLGRNGKIENNLFGKMLRERQPK
jgi:hypothetical protein